jgi:hypothetical protein
VKSPQFGFNNIIQKLETHSLAFNKGKKMWAFEWIRTRSSSWALNQNKLFKPNTSVINAFETNIGLWSNHKLTQTRKIHYNPDFEGGIAFFLIIYIVNIYCTYIEVTKMWGVLKLRILVLPNYDSWISRTHNFFKTSNLTI